MHIPEGEFYRPLSLKRFSVDSGLDLFAETIWCPTQDYTAQRTGVALLRANTVPRHACRRLPGPEICPFAEAALCQYLFIDLNFPERGRAFTCRTAQLCSPVRLVLSYSCNAYWPSMWK